jgi:hypothetical protein
MIGKHFFSYIELHQFFSTNGIPALSLPASEKLDADVFSYLEDFDLIYLWFPLIHEKYAKGIIY